MKRAALMLLVTTASVTAINHHTFRPPTAGSAPESAGLDMPRPSRYEARKPLLGVRKPRRIPVRPAPHLTPSMGTVWLRLVQCEASGNWHANTGNGFYGGLQFTQSTWAAYGGLRFAPRADLASPLQQVLIAKRVLRGQGWEAWPVCSKRIGVA